MAYRSLLENLRAEFQDIRCDEAPGKIPILVPAGLGREGNAIEFLLKGRKNQQTVHVYRTLPNLTGTFYVAARFQFPQGFNWTTPPGIDSYANEHKLFIIDTENSVGRILVNLRGGGLSPQLAVHTEKTGPYLWKDSENQHAYGPGSGISNWSDVRWPADGQWHDLEVEVERTGRGSDRVRLWLDGKIAMDVIGRTCGESPSPIISYKVGAFFNGAPPNDTRFRVTDIRDDVTQPIPPVVVVPPAKPDVAAALAQLDAAVSVLSGAREAVVKASAALDEARRMLRLK